MFAWKRGRIWHKLVQKDTCDIQFPASFNIKWESKSCIFLFLINVLFVIKKNQISSTSALVYFVGGFLGLSMPHKPLQEYIHFSIRVHTKAAEIWLQKYASFRRCCRRKTIILMTNSNAEVDTDGSAGKSDWNASPMTWVPPLAPAHCPLTCTRVL